MEANTNSNNHKSLKRRLNASLALCLGGFFIFLLGADPGLFSLDRVPLVGFVQTATFSTGLALLCLGGFISFKNNGDLIVSSVAHRESMRKMGLPENHKLNVGDFTYGQKNYLNWHRDSILL